VFLRIACSVYRMVERLNPCKTCAGFGFLAWLLGVCKVAGVYLRFLCGGRHGDKKKKEKEMTK
jgi:hypothetical protein